MPKQLGYTCEDTKEIIQGYWMAARIINRSEAFWLHSVYLPPGFTQERFRPVSAFLRDHVGQPHFVLGDYNMEKHSKPDLWLTQELVALGLREAAPPTGTKSFSIKGTPKSLIDRVWHTQLSHSATTKVSMVPFTNLLTSHAMLDFEARPSIKLDTESRK